jgi:hypothetical protein
MRPNVFKVGDRVILARVPFGSIRGEAGTVEAVNESHAEVRVDGIGTEDNYPIGRCIAKVECFDLEDRSDVQRAKDQTNDE